MGRPCPQIGSNRWQRAVLALLLLASAGCTSDWFKRDVDRRRDDPLLGIGARPANQPVAVATANQPQPNYAPTPPPATGSLPPLAPATPTSNAALAAGAFSPLPGGSDLRIGQAPPPTSGAFTDPRLNSGNSGSPVRPIPAGAVTSGPQTSPIRPVSTNGLPPLVPTSSPVGGGLDQGLAAIAGYKPLSQKLTFNAQTNEWFFEVKTPVPGGGGQAVKEATAATPELAVRAVLEQLSRQQ
jgi:hypothetical protein